MNRFEFYSNVEKFKNNQSSDELSHYGIIGQKWGTRRWQNTDGTFNDEGKIRYFGKSKKVNAKYQNEDGSLTQEYYDELAKLYNEGNNKDKIEKLYKQIDWEKMQESSKKITNDSDKKYNFGDPSEYEDDFESYVEDNWEIAAKKRGYDPDDVLTDEQYEIINQDMKDYFYENKKYVEPNKDYEIPIDNPDLKDIPFSVHNFRVKDDNVNDVNKTIGKTLKYLNDKKSVNEIMDNYAEYEYKYYKEYAEENGIKPISESEFKKYAKDNLDIEEVGLSIYNDDNFAIMIAAKNNNFPYFKKAYDAISIDVDPENGKISNFYYV